jgi:hypothetical protein
MEEPYLYTLLSSLTPTPLFFIHSFTIWRVNFCPFNGNKNHQRKAKLDEWRERERERGEYLKLPSGPGDH